MSLRGYTGFLCENWNSHVAKPKVPGNVVLHPDNPKAVIINRPVIKTKCRIQSPISFIRVMSSL